MEVTLWGVRGSIPAPGPATVRYGGNTSCVSVRTQGGKLLVLDCGTGARNLGLALLAERGADGFHLGSAEAAILISHAHWDHIQGFPFFGPLYVEGNVFKVYGPADTSERREGFSKRKWRHNTFRCRRSRTWARVSRSPRWQRATVRRVRLPRHAVSNPQGGLPRCVQDRRSESKWSTRATRATVRGDHRRSEALYQDADLLIHDCTYTDGGSQRYPNRGARGGQPGGAAAVRGRAASWFYFTTTRTTPRRRDLLVERARHEIRRARTDRSRRRQEGLTFTCEPRAPAVDPLHGLRDPAPCHFTLRDQIPFSIRTFNFSAMVRHPCDFIRRTAPDGPLRERLETRLALRGEVTELRLERMLDPQRRGELRDLLHDDVVLVQLAHASMSSPSVESASSSRTARCPAVRDRKETRHPTQHPVLALRGPVLKLASMLAK